MKGRAVAAILLCLCIAPLARAEMVVSGNLRVKVTGQLRPRELPRIGKAPVKVSVGAEIAPRKQKVPPALRRMQIAINRNGTFDTRGLPVCPLDEIQPATTADALRNCRGSLVGRGLFSAKVLLKGQASFPSTGELYAFNSRVGGRPAILAHVYGTQPAPASFTLVFQIRKSKRTLGTTLTATLPDVTEGSGYVTGISMRLGKNYRFHGRRHSYISAGCPAPQGINVANYPFARVSFGFDDGRTLHSRLIRTCRAHG